MDVNLPAVDEHLAQNMQAKHLTPVIMLSLIVARESYTILDAAQLADHPLSMN
ncbi:hypothetical protein [Actinoplanes sp. GCM10030250]|uniref:hypothetical protein n=1 Tax=Actinoplanes sp. GCM10030250 TaxID=3273376 RepID=UPI003614C2FD